MNCTQVEKMLPLFVSADLTDRETALVQSHLQHCAACSAELAAFSASSLWVKESRGDELFNEAFYADLRTSVHAALARETYALQTKLGKVQESLGKSRKVRGAYQRFWHRLFQTNQDFPRLSWTYIAILAAMLLFTAGFWLSRFIPSKGVPAPDIALSPSQQPTPAPTKQQVDQKPLLAQALKRAKPNKLRATLPSQESTAKSQPQEVALTQPATLPLEVAAALPPDEPRAPEMLRIEMQTADPNIRIIWLTPRTAAAGKE